MHRSLRLVVALGIALSGALAPPPAAAADDLHGGGDILRYATRVTTGGPANEVDLAVNPTNPYHVVAVAKDYSLGPSSACSTETVPAVSRVWAAIYVSFDGGAHWEYQLFPGYPGDSRRSAAAGYVCMSDPLVAFAPTGALYFVGLAIRKPTATGDELNSLVFAISTDGGRTWPVSLMQVLGLANYPYVPDKPQMAVDATTGAIAIVYQYIFGLQAIPILYEGGADGRSFTYRRLGGSIVLWPTVAWGSDSSLLVAGLSYCETEPGWCVHLMTRRPLSADFEDVEVDARPTGENRLPNTSGAYRVFVSPSLAADPLPGGGTIAIAYHAWDATAERWQLTVASTRGDGVFAIVRPSTNPARHQVLPRLAVAPGGSMEVLYYEDDGTTAAPGRVTARLVVNPSGALWRAPVSLSKSFDPTSMRNQFGNVFIGDYVGLKIGPNGCPLAAWADGRNGRSEVFFFSFPSVFCQEDSAILDHLCVVPCEIECPRCREVYAASRIPVERIRTITPIAYRAEGEFVMLYVQKACALASGVLRAVRDAVPPVEGVGRADGAVGPSVGDVRTPSAPVLPCRALG